MCQIRSATLQIDGQSMISAVKKSISTVECYNDLYQVHKIPIHSSLSVQLNSAINQWYSFECFCFSHLNLFLLFFVFILSTKNDYVVLLKIAYSILYNLFVWEKRAFLFFCWDVCTVLHSHESTFLIINFVWFYILCGIEMVSKCVCNISIDLKKMRFANWKRKSGVKKVSIKFLLERKYWVLVKLLKLREKSVMKFNGHH